MANKKTPAKKSASKNPVAKKTAAPAKPKVASVNDIQREESFANKVSELIKTGNLDSQLSMLLDSLNERAAVWAKANKKTQSKGASPRKTAAEKNATKKVPTAPKKPVALEKGKTYTVKNSKTLGGAKVKFVRLKKEDENKAVVELMAAKGDRKKGSKVAVPTKCLA